MIQAADLNNLFDRTLALSLQPPMKGDNLLIITNGGGVGVLATDAAEKYGIPLKFAPADVQAELKKHMPEFGSAKNPVDLTGMAGIEWYADCIRFSLAHPWVDGLVVLYCETAMTDPMEIAQGIKKAYDEADVKGKSNHGFLRRRRAIGKSHALAGRERHPCLCAPDLAVNAMAALREYARMKAMINETMACDFQADRAAALDVIRLARVDGRGSLTEIEAKQVFSAYGLPTTATLSWQRPKTKPYHWQRRSVSRS